jgi:hypothetical protein
VEPTNPEFEDAVPPTTDLSGEAPTVAINTGLLPTMAQHCTRCGATLAADQRYCVVCGERRGEPRLPFMDGRTPAAATTTTTVIETAAVPPAAAKPRFSAGATLIGGVATLLLALGVGVLIGNAGQDDKGSAQAAAPQVITVNGGGAPAAATSTTATTADSGADKSAAKKDAKAAKAKTDTKSAADQQKAAKAVVSAPAGSEIPQAAAPKVVQGQKGSGPGYKDGKFTGDFFGG